MKKVFICLIVILVVFLSFFLPKVLFKLEDLKRDSVSHKTDMLSGKIDVQAENIYLVKAIHDIQDRRIKPKIKQLFV